MNPLTLTDHSIEVEGATIFARRWDANGANHCHLPLFLLHDSLGSVELWRDFPATLAMSLNRSVIAYDRLGFGRSTPCRDLPRPDFVTQEAESVFPAVRKYFGVEEFTVLGHSVGGSMALLAACHAKTTCKAVISVSAPAFVEDKTVTGIRNATEQFDKPEQFARLERWHGSRAKWVLDAWSQVWQSEDFANWSLAPWLPNVTCPVLVIHGDQDEFGSPRVPAAICEQVGGPAQLEILEGVGHIPHREQPKVVLQLISQFLSDHGLPKRSER